MGLVCQSGVGCFQGGAWKFAWKLSREVGRMRGRVQVATGDWFGELKPFLLKVNGKPDSGPNHQLIIYREARWKPITKELSFGKAQNGFLVKVELRSKCSNFAK